MSEYIVKLSDAIDMPDMVGGERITRCRDCKRYYPKKGEMLSCRFEYNGFVQWRSAEPDGFCKWGEPKGDTE